MGGVAFSSLNALAANETLIKMYMSTIKPQPWPTFEGVKYPSFIPFRMKGIDNHIRDVMNFKSRETDILITTYSKSGSHWIFEIVTALLHNSEDLSSKTKVESMLDAIPALGLLDQAPSPRLINTHLPFRYLPKQHIENQYKIVHFVRNPKDVCVSFFHHVQKDIFIDIHKPWQDYFEMWMDGDLPYDTWYDYECEFEQASKDHPQTIITLYYEDMIKYPCAQMKKLAKFLDIECTENEIKKATDLTTFDNMKQNKKDMSGVMTKDGDGFIYRKGKIGDWKNYFTVKQNERFDAQFEEKMKDSKLKLEFT